MKIMEDRTERIAKKITELYDEPQGGNKIENLSEADSLWLAFPQVIVFLYDSKWIKEF